MLLVGLLLVNSYVASRIQQPEERLRVPYSPVFLDQVQAGNVASISSQESTVQGEFRRAIRLPSAEADAPASRLFDTEAPAFADTEELSDLLREKDVAVNAEAPETGPSLIESMLSALLPTLLLVGLLVWLFRRAAGAAGGALGGFGRSRGRRIEPSAERVTFADIAGIDEAKAELAEIVDFLRNPDKYRRVGGRIPRGVLLTGPPGAGTRAGSTSGWPSSLLARNMVARWGMSDAIGPIAVTAPVGPAATWPAGAEVSPETLHLVDLEVRQIVDEAHGAVTELLTRHRDALDRLAHTLLERETLDEHDARAAAGMATTPAISGHWSAAPRPESPPRAGAR